ncbi:MAG: ATP-binding protein [Candidatus Promineifilaceae bacterium]
MAIPSAQPDPLGQPAHILIVDDEPNIVQVLSELLGRAAGYRISTAEDGLEAQRFLEQSARNPHDAVDLVLLDVRMPFMSGPELLAWLRSHPSLRYTRVIVLTAGPSQGDKIVALQAGADDYIAKPAIDTELLARVGTILRTQQLEKQLQRQGHQLAALNRYNQTVTASLTTADVLAAAVEGTVAFLDAEATAVFMLGSSGRALRCQAVYPIAAPEPKRWPPVPTGRGLIGAAFGRGPALCLADVGQDERFDPAVDVPTGLAPRSFLAAPLLVRNRPVGLLAAFSRREGAFGEVDCDLFSSWSNSVSRALEIAWLVGSLRTRQQELLDSRNELQAVMDGILTPIYTVDRDYRLVAINANQRQQYGGPAAALVGRLCYQALFSREGPCEHCQVAATLAGRQARRWTAELPGPAYLPAEWDVSAYPLPGSKAGAGRAVVVWQDRTEERRLERSLLQANKLAAIGQLAAGVAHEINNPLTVINANAQMLQMALSPEDENYEPADLIVQAGERAARVVLNLLDLARESQYTFESVAVNDSIQRALNLVGYQFAIAHIEVEADLDASLPPIQGSWQHLQVVWLNLLINARDALRDRNGAGRVQIVSRAEPDGQWISVTVSDNGHGLGPAELAHIFEPFFTTKSPGAGTGLGLATSHRIVEGHGGQIVVSSQPGQGATFLVRLPVLRP